MAKVDVEVSDRILRDTVCSAFEGGSNYWYWVEDTILPAGTVEADFREGGKFQTPGDYYPSVEIIPTVPGGALVITAAPDGASPMDDEEPRDVREDDMLPAILNREALLRGAAIMAEKHPRHFGNMMGDNGDAETGDVLLQLALYGELIFG